MALYCRRQTPEGLLRQPRQVTRGLCGHDRRLVQALRSVTAQRLYHDFVQVQPLLRQT